MYISSRSHSLGGPVGLLDSAASLSPSVCAVRSPDICSYLCGCVRMILISIFVSMLAFCRISDRFQMQWYLHVAQRNDVPDCIDAIEYVETVDVENIIRNLDATPV